MDHSPIPKPEFLKRQITISTINKQFESKSILKKEPQQQPQIIDIATEDKRKLRKKYIIKCPRKIKDILIKV